MQLLEDRLLRADEQRYRSGHNGADSKTSDHFGTAFLKNLDFSRLWGYHQEEKLL